MGCMQPVSSQEADCGPEAASCAAAQWGRAQGSVHHVQLMWWGIERGATYHSLYIGEHGGGGRHGVDKQPSQHAVCLMCSSGVACRQHM